MYSTRYDLDIYIQFLIHVHIVSCSIYKKTGHKLYWYTHEHPLWNFQHEFQIWFGILEYIFKVRSLTIDGSHHCKDTMMDLITQWHFHISYQHLIRKASSWNSRCDCHFNYLYLWANNSISLLYLFVLYLSLVLNCYLTIFFSNIFIKWGLGSPCHNLCD